MRRRDEVKRLSPPEAAKNAATVGKDTSGRMNQALSVAVLESHYFVNGCLFDSDEGLLMKEHTTAHLPKTFGVSPARRTCHSSRVARREYRARQPCRAQAWQWHPHPSQC